MRRPARRTPARLGRQRDRCAIAPRTSRRPDCARGPIDGLTSIARPGRSANGSAWLTLRALGRRMPPGPDRRADAAGAAALLSVCSRTPPNPWPKRVSIDVPAPGSVSASLSDAPHEQCQAPPPQQLGATRPAWSAVSAIFHLRRRRICRSAGAAPWRWRAGGGHARELVGDAVRLMLERVVDLSEDELRLYVWCTRLDAYGLQALMFSVGLLHLTLRAPATAGASALKLWLGHAHRPSGYAATRPPRYLVPCFGSMGSSRSSFRLCLRYRWSKHRGATLNDIPQMGVVGRQKVALGRTSVDPNRFAAADLGPREQGSHHGPWCGRIRPGSTPLAGGRRMVLLPASAVNSACSDILHMPAPERRR